MPAGISTQRSSSSGRSPSPTQRTTSTTARSSSPQPVLSSESGCSTSPPVDLKNPAEVSVALKTYKRRLAALDEKLAKATQGPNKRGTTIKTIGRGARKVVTLFESLSSVVDEADRRVVEGEALHACPKEQRNLDRLYRAYPLLLRLAPGLKKVIMNETPDEVSAYLSQLQEGANSGRADDVHRIKDDVVGWVNQDYKPNVLLCKDHRNNRGYQHDICGMLLTPIMYDWNNPEVRAGIRGSKEGYIINSNYYLTCLYPHGRYNANKLELNFLRSKLLLQTYCSIFTSPSSAQGVEEIDSANEAEGRPVAKKRKSKKATKGSVASIINMEGKVTGRSIAYAAVILVFNLHDVAQWVDTHNNFSFVGFYNFLVDYFEEERTANSTRRVKQLLSWWNEQVFPQHVSSNADTDESRQLLLDQDDDY